jgi:expansin (peptidoglycan-binding protein)
MVVATLLQGCGGDDGGGGDGGDGGGATCDAEERDGIATYYAATGAGNCSFDATPEDLMVAAMNDPDYEGSQVCGECVAVDGPGGSVTVRIVDRCPECESGHLDLSMEAFALIAEVELGRVDITWRVVPCDVDGPVEYWSQQGSNDFYLAVQLRNIRHPVASLEGRASGEGAYVDMPRVDYNYFLAETGLGPGPYDFRATDVNGHVLEDLVVALPHGGLATGGDQFPACEGTRTAPPSTGDSVGFGSGCVFCPQSAVGGTSSPKNAPR